MRATFKVLPNTITTQSMPPPPPAVAAHAVVLPGMHPADKPDRLAVAVVAQDAATALTSERGLEHVGLPGVANMVLGAAAEMEAPRTAELGAGRVVRVQEALVVESTAASRIEGLGTATEPLQMAR